MNQVAVFFEGLSMQSIIPQGKAFSNKASGDSIPLSNIINESGTRECRCR